MQQIAQELFCILSEANVKRLTELFNDGFSGTCEGLKLLAKHPNGISAGEISEKLNVTTARTAVLIETLVKRGYAVRSRATDDGRKVIVKITPSGIDFAVRQKQQTINYLTQLLSALSANEANQFNELAKKIISSQGDSLLIKE